MKYMVGKTTKGEIDFVAVKDGKEYYQVAYLLATEDVTRKRILRLYEGYSDPIIRNMYISMDRLIFKRRNHTSEYNRLFDGKVKNLLTDSKESTILTLIKGSNWRL
mgnify:CR=1 FL=1